MTSFKSLHASTPLLVVALSLSLSALLVPVHAQLSYSEQRLGSLGFGWTERSIPAWNNVDINRGTVVALDDYVLLVGGTVGPFNGYSYTYNNNVYYWRPTMESWDVVLTTSTLRSLVSPYLVRIGPNRVLLMGGYVYANSGLSNNNDIYTWQDSVWTRVARTGGVTTTFGSIRDACAYFAQGTVVFLGGFMSVSTNGGEANPSLRTVYKSADMGASWSVYTQPSALSVGWIDSACGYLGGKHWVWGGKSDDRDSYGNKNVYVSDNAETYTILGSLPSTMPSRPGIPVPFGTDAMFFLGTTDEPYNYVSYNGQQFFGFPAPAYDATGTSASFVLSRGSSNSPFLRVMQADVSSSNWTVYEADLFMSPYVIAAGCYSLTDTPTCDSPGTRVQCSSNGLGVGYRGPRPDKYCFVSTDNPASLCNMPCSDASRLSALSSSLSLLLVSVLALFVRSLV